MYDKKLVYNLFTCDDSEIMANVAYNGTQIYINSVNEKKRTADIHPLNKPQSIQDVSLNDLLEH